MTNQNELFDVVDDQDQVIGQATRGDVHARDLLHRAIHVLIYNHAGEIFLQKRSLRKDRFPGCWDSSCSGHVNAGEDYFTAAVRELEEELGWKAGPLALRPMVKLAASPRTGFEFIQVYMGGPSSGTFTLDPEEISEGHYARVEELDSLLAHHPEQAAGALRFLWQNHRDEILAEMSFNA